MSWPCKLPLSELGCCQDPVPCHAQCEGRLGSVSSACRCTCSREGPGLPLQFACGLRTGSQTLGAPAGRDAGCRGTPRCAGPARPSCGPPGGSEAETSPTKMVVLCSCLSTLDTVYSQPLQAQGGSAGLHKAATCLCRGSSSSVSNRGLATTPCRLHACSSQPVSGVGGEHAVCGQCTETGPTWMAHMRLGQFGPEQELVSSAATKA